MPTRLELETLVTYLVGDNSDLKKKLQEAEKAFELTQRVANRATSQILSDMQRMGAGAIGLAASVVGISSAMDTLFRGVQLAADAEALSVTFRVLVGDVEKADNALRDLQQFALTTPFEMPELMESARMMLAFGEEVENIVPAMRMMGDIASGIDAPLKDLAYLFGTLRAQGRAFTVDIRQFASRGIPIYLELAKVFGLVDENARKTTKEVRQQLDKMIEAGQVSFEQVEEAFNRMTGPGGQFFGMMEQRSKTLKGLFNEMKESIDLSLRGIGESLIKGLDLHLVVRNVTRLTEQFNKWLSGLSPGVKKAISLFLSLSAVVVGITIAFAAISFLFGLVFTVTGGIAAAIAIVIGLIAIWVDSVGGLSEAWSIVKQKSEEFWDFIRPAIPALAVLLSVIFPIVGALGLAIGLLVTYWDDVTEAVSNFWRESQPVLRDVRELLNTVAIIVRDHLVHAFEWASRQARDFRDWVAEITDEIEQAWEEMDRGVKDVFNTVNDFVGFLLMAFGPAVDFIRKQFGKTWREFRDDLRENIMRVEFFFKTFRTHAGYAIAVAHNEIVKFIAIVSDLFTRILPKSLDWFTSNWKAVFTAAFNVAKAVVENMINLLVEGIKSIPDIISGDLRVADLIKKHNDKFVTDIKAAIGNVPPLELGMRPDTDAEKAAREWVGEFERDLDMEWDRFKRNRAKKFQLEDAFDAVRVGAKVLLGLEFGQLDQAAADAGQRTGNIFSTEFGKATSTRWDAALFGSSEAISRIEAYKNQFPIDLQQRADAQPKVVVQTTPPPANSTELAMLQQLTMIAVGVNELVKKPGVPLIPAALD